MAKVTLNSAIKGVRGGIDNWVYRRVGSRMVVGPQPTPSTTPPSAAQVESRNRFRAAASYARSVLADPAKRAFYLGVSQLKEIPVFAVAVADFFKPPMVHVIDASEYHGVVGQKIKVLASDDVEVTSVNVAIRETNGTLIQQGAATKVGEEWFYTSTVAVPLAHAVKIRATAKDRPGNEGFLEKDHTT